MLILGVKMLSAQSPVLNGRITVDGRPLTGAKVEVGTSGRFVLTDARGAFHLDAAPEPLRLKVSHPACEPLDTLFESGVVGGLNDVKLECKQRIVEIPQAVVIGSRGNAGFNRAGAGQTVSQKDLEEIQPVSANEVLRVVPGLNVVDEEGLGLRPNIGFRGLDPDRSRYVLVLEDGVPVSLGPYNEPELYYAPSIDRMVGVEVLKGSAAIEQGPRTIAGVVNYRTEDPPPTEQGRLSLQGGPGGYTSALGTYGNTVGNAGFRITVLRKQSDEFGMLRLRLNDITTRFRWIISDRSIMGFKAGIYQETSNANYIGLTNAMLEAGGNDFTRLAPDDRFRVRRYSLSGNYSHRFTERLQIDVLMYAYTTQRDWCRQDFTYSALDASGQMVAPPIDWSGVTWGDTTVSGGAIHMRNSTGNRIRSYEVAGADIRLKYEMEIGRSLHTWTLGVKSISEWAHERRVNGTYPGDISGTISDEEMRPVLGISAFLSDRITWNHLEVVPGIRIENMYYQREILRGKYNGETIDTNIIGKGRLVQLIPGASLVYKVHEVVRIYGGVHRGFAPPRVKDAISTDGTDVQLDAERSVNYEAGVRTQLTGHLTTELTAFLLDFSNQVIPVSESSGAGGGAGLVNGGGTRSQGLELSMQMEEVPLNKNGWNISAHVAATFTDARFSEDRFNGSGESRVNLRGNQLPYAPRWTTNVRAEFAHNTGWMLMLAMQHTGAQFTDIRNTIDPSANGQAGRLNAFRVVDAGLRHQWEKYKLHSSLTIRNLFDARYAYTRRPQGTRVGLPRMLFVGLSKEF